MSGIKEIDFLCEEIADVLGVSSRAINLSRVPDGWLGDVYTSGKKVKGEVRPKPIDALKSLLEECKK